MAMSVFVSYRNCCSKMYASKGRAHVGAGLLGYSAHMYSGDLALLAPTRLFKFRHVKQKVECIPAR